MKIISRARRGVTLIEMFVVLAIIAGLLCLLIPAVGSAREAARRAQCQANLHQIGVGMTHFIMARRKLPGAAVAGQMSGWAIEILPFIEENTLADGLTGSALGSPAAVALAQKRPPIMRCPDGYDGDSDIVGIPASHYIGVFSRGDKGFHWMLGDLPTDSRIAWVTSPEGGLPRNASASLLPHTGGYNLVETEPPGDFASVHFISSD